jgi:hypothetical protein
LARRAEAWMLARFRGYRSGSSDRITSERVPVDSPRRPASETRSR